MGGGREREGIFLIQRVQQNPVGRSEAGASAPAPRVGERSAHVPDNSPRRTGALCRLMLGQGIFVC